MENFLADLVIGSGPTAFAAALGIVQRGGHPVLMDFGEDGAGARPRFAGTSGMAVKGGADGRDHVFAYPSSLVAAVDGGHLPLSSARGGLSRIWGAGIFMRGDEELAQFGPAEPGVREGYECLLAAMPATGCTDATSARFPWPADRPVAPQSLRFARLAKALQTPAGDGVLFGYPRLALDLSTPPGCVRCGECLSGCPEHLFFDASRRLETMAVDGTVSWMPGPALFLALRANGVEVATPGGIVRAERVYLAGGPVATASILQRSGLVTGDVELEDSAVFYTAYLNINGPTDDAYEFASTHLMAFADRPGPGDFQLAIYEANREYRTRFREVLRVMPSGLIPDIILRRVNAGIGFVGPQVSGRLVVKTVPGGRTWVVRRANPRTRAAARSVVARVGKRLRANGVRPVPGALVVPPPGSGYHVGAGMPLGGSVVDHQGRLRDAPAIHVVDASSLPQVWAGSHTFTAMANAHRIARGAE